MAIVKICTKQFLLINLISQAILQICQSKALLVARKPNKTRLVWTIMQRRNITCQKNWKHTHLHLCAACLHNPFNKMLAPQNPKKRMRKREGGLWLKILLPLVFFEQFQEIKKSVLRDHQGDEARRIKGEDGWRARLLLLLPRTTGGDDEDDEELEDVNLFDSLVNFFFSPSQALSSVLWFWTLVEFKFAGRTQLHRKPAKHHLTLHYENTCGISLHVQESAQQTD